MNINTLLLKYQEKGILLYVENDKLCYESPQNVVDETIKEEIRKYKEEILEYLIHGGNNQIISDENNKYEPFSLSSIQSSYMLGSSQTYDYGGMNCKIYSEFKYPKLDLNKLQLAWENVVKNNDMLHAMMLKNGTQKILDNWEVPRIKEWDFKNCTYDEVQKHLLEIREILFNKKYSVETWPLFDMGITQTSDSSILHFSLDMIIADFVSISIIMNELESYYFEDFKSIQKTLSFRDVIVFNENRNKFPSHLSKMERDRKYWTERISQMPDAPKIPMRNNRSVETKQFNLLLENKKIVELEEVCKKYRISLSSLILAVYVETLSRWSGNNHFCVNITLNKRDKLHSEIDRIVGDFTTTNLLEVQLFKKSRFIDRALQIQNQLWRDIEHSTYSGVDVIRHLSKEKKRNIVMPYVYTSTLGIENNDNINKITKYGNLEYKISQTPQVLIDCQVMRGNNGIFITWDYKDVFPENMIKDAFESFSTALLEGVQNNLYEENEIIKISKKTNNIRSIVNNTSKNFEPKTLIDGFYNNVRDCPKLEAVKFEETSYSYEILGRYVATIQSILKSKGCIKGDIVAIDLKRGVWQIAATMGCLMNGLIYLPLAQDQPIDRKNRILSSSKAKCVITSNSSIYEENSNYLNEIKILNVDCIDKIVNEELEINNVEPDDIAYVIYTSGSTGEPKGVIISHKAAMNTITDIIGKFNITNKDKVLCLSNLAFDLSVFDIFGLLTVGGTLIIPQNNKDLVEWQKLIESEKITIWNTVPAQMEMFASYLKAEQLKGADSLRLVMLSGDWIPVNLPIRIRELFKNTDIVSLGGAKEASIWSIFHIIDPTHRYEKSIPYGKPLSNQEFYVLDNDLNTCPDWVEGRLYIAGEGLANGYLNDPKLSSEKFIMHEKLKKRLYDTGDNGRYHPDGTIEFLGRVDGQVKIRGHRVELAELESVANSFPKVDTSVAILSNKNKNSIILFVKISNTIQSEKNEDIESILESELKEYLGMKLPNYMMPSYIKFISEIPLTQNCKIDRNKLADFFIEDFIEESSTLSEMERRIKIIWEKILDTRRIELDDNFYNVGGDSLLAAKIVASIKEEFDTIKKLNWDELMVALIEKPTIRELSDYIERLEMSNESKNINYDSEKVVTNDLNNLIFLRSNPESDTTKVFVHDGSGTLNAYSNLFQHLSKVNDNVIGIICNDMEQYLRTEDKKVISQLGQKYAEEIYNANAKLKKIELIGYCIGGFISVEMAKILAEKRVEIVSVTCIDSIPMNVVADNDILLEKAFGMTMGADVGKLGYFDDNVIYDAIFQLKEKYGEKFSDDRYLELGDSYPTVKEDYIKLSKISKTDRIRRIYDYISKKNIEFEKNVTKEQFEGVFELFKKSFRAIKYYEPEVYFGKVNLLLCDNTPLGTMTTSKPDVIEYWNKFLVGDLEKKDILGTHVDCLTEEYYESVLRGLF